MIQKETIRKIDLLHDYLNKVISYASLSTDELLNNFEKLATFERYFILMADEAFDINAALAYQIGNKIPESNRSTFYEIADLNIISREFADKISLSAKTRNNLIHNYDMVQKSVIIDDMKRFTELYKEFLKVLIEKFVAKEE